MGSGNGSRAEREAAVKALMKDSENSFANVPEAKDAGFDVEAAFQLYALNSGNVELTAHALRVTPSEINRVAVACEWQRKLQVIFDLAKSARPGDVERAMSRTINFVQAHRMRIVLDRLISRFYRMTEQELYDACCPETFDSDGKSVGRRVNSRPFADLASAMEKVHAITYLALMDTATERVRRKEQEDTANAGQLHAAMAKALAEQSTVKDKPEVARFEEQLRLAEELAATETK
jgi:hypothetical protein